MEDLEEYIENTEDVQLSMMVEIVNKYGNEIPNILKELKEKHLDAADKHKAEIVFSTVHRAKGMEYDEVELVNDFINEKRLDRQLKDEKEVAFEAARTDLNEVADALREKLINQELENKFSQLSPEEIEILRNMIPTQMSIPSIQSEEEMGKL
jgi:superfamily I DNA/RNA helicase